MDQHANDNQLHYDMLNYLYDKGKYSRAMFNYTWQNFKEGGYSKLVGEKSAQELKMIFFGYILPHLEDYELLNQEQREYFEMADYFDDAENDETILDSLVGNEPVRGVDYESFRSFKDYSLHNQSQVVGYSSLRDTFKRPTVANEKSIKIDILEQDLSSLSIKNLEHKPVDVSNAFRKFLAPDMDKEEADDKIARLLADENFLSDIDSLNSILPLHLVDIIKRSPAIRKLMSEGGPSEDESEEEQEVGGKRFAMSTNISSIENIQSEPVLSACNTPQQSSIIIPQLNFSSSTSSGIITRSRSETNTPSHTFLSSANSRNRVANPATNQKMDIFTRRFRNRNKK